MSGVCILLVAALPFSEMDYRLVADYDFSELSTSNTSYEHFVPDKYGYAFSGVKIRMMAGSPGMLLLSTNDSRGYLIMPPESRNGGDALFLSAKKFSDDDFKSENSRMPIAWTSGAETNEFARVLIETNFCWSAAIDISSIPADADILINYGTAQYNRKVWIDRIIFAKEREHGFYLIIR